MILAHNKIGLLNINKVRTIIQPKVLEFQQAVFPELVCSFPSFGQAFSMFLIIKFSHRTYLFSEYLKQALAPIYFFSSMNSTFLAISP